MKGNRSGYFSGASGASSGGNNGPDAYDAHVEQLMELQDEIRRAASPDSPGGPVVTPEEHRYILWRVRRCTYSAEGLRMGKVIKHQIDRRGAQCFAEMRVFLNRNKGYEVEHYLSDAPDDPQPPCPPAPSLVRVRFRLVQGQKGARLVGDTQRAKGRSRKAAVMPR